MVGSVGHTKEIPGDKAHLLFGKFFLKPVYHGRCKHPVPLYGPVKDFFSYRFGNIADIGVQAAPVIVDGVQGKTDLQMAQLTQMPGKEQYIVFQRSNMYMGVRKLMQVPEKPFDKWSVVFLILCNPVQFYR